MCRRMKLDHFLMPHTKNKLKADEKPKRETGIHQNPREEHEVLLDLSHSNFLLEMSPKARETKAKMNYWDFIKMKSFCSAKETVDKTKRQPKEWEKRFANVLSDKGLVSKIYKEFIKLNTQRTHKPIRKWTEDMNTHFSKEDIQMANGHMKNAQRHSASGK